MGIQDQALRFRAQSSVLWLAVGALAAVQAAFTIAWVSYRVNLVNLVSQAGLPNAIAPQILLVEALLAIALEPLIGRWTDHQRRQRDNRFPIITVGIGLSAVLLLLLPFVATAGWSWLLVILLVCWAIAMSLFRVPVLSLLKHLAAAPHLPQAASLITFAASLAGAAMPLGKPLIASLGTRLSFLICALFLVTTAAILAIVMRTPDTRKGFATPHSVDLHPGWMFGLGFAVPFLLRLMVETFPKVLKVQVAGVNPPIVVGVMFLAAAIAAFPAGAIAVRFGNRRTMLAGLAGLALCLLLLPLLTNLGVAFVLAIAAGIAFSLVSNGTLPLILSRVSRRNSGFAVGVFLSGTALATSLFEFFNLRDPLAIWFSVGLGLIAVLIAAGCVSRAKAI